MAAVLKVKNRKHKYGARPQWLVGTIVCASKVDALASVATWRKLTGETVTPIYFASKRELKCWFDLCERQRRGEISGLGRQIRYKLIGKNGSVIESYVCDFRWIENGKEVIGDAKGKMTEAYKRKKKWMKQELNIDILEL